MKYEIHSHTKETSQCAKISAKELVEKYKELGYSGIVITNHYSDQQKTACRTLFSWLQRSKKI